ncbi:unnamed protein product [Rotaria sp. Silwood2]|nr:unnamed protein product [Rotaria sp. Silwood2]CAF4577396.1 unnamed protein product [Rotaria sp. Silwood2]
MTKLLTVQDRALIATRYEMWQSVIEVQRWWRSQWGRHATLHPDTIKNCHQKLMTTGSVCDTERSGRHSSSRSPEIVDIVREMFTQSPGTSIRKASLDTGLTYYTIHSVLKKELNYRAWKPHLVQQIFPEDCDIRMEFSEIMFGWKDDWPELFDNILWSDEAIFHVGGFVNRHNCHYWGDKDPGMKIEKMQSQPKIVVWCGFTSTKFIGPYVLHDTMNGERYLKMLKNLVWPVISQWSNIDELIFMHDGAPPHYARTVRNWLDNNFPLKWIDRRGPTSWPPRSPDLTPCDFFLWGWAKNEVYKTNPKTLTALEERIHTVLNNVPQQFLKNSTNNVQVRLQKSIDNK